MASFQIPLNLPHAGTVAHRIALQLDGKVDWFARENADLSRCVRELQELLLPFRETGENPPVAQAVRVRAEAAQLGRRLVGEIIRLDIGADRLGQCVRNLFECLELGQEGADLGLLAGEDPRSLARPA